MAYDVVISYSRRNREIADRLAEHLRQRGIVPWYDRLIKPGADWRDEIANAITGARIFLILFSAESNDSQELRKELAIADRHRLLIVPVRVENVEPKGLFEYELARRQWFDIFDDWKAGLPGVVEHLAEAVQSLSSNAADASKDQDAQSRERSAAPASGPKEVRAAQPSPLREEVSARAKSQLAASAGPFNLLRSDAIAVFGIAFFSLVALLTVLTANEAVPGTLGYVCVKVAGPLWLAFQIWLVIRAGVGRPFAKVARIVACVALGAGLVGAATIGTRGGDFLVGYLGLFGGPLLILTLLGLAAVRRQTGGLFWILPVFSTGAILVGYPEAGADWPDGQLFCGLGVLFGCAVYATDIIWRRPAPAHAP